MRIKPGDIALFPVSDCMVTDASKSTKGEHRAGREGAGGGCREWSSEVVGLL